MNPHPRPSRDLTEREYQVLYWISHGLSNGQIGRNLYLTEDTVKTHCRKLFRRLGATDRAHAVRLGFESGALRFGGPAPRAMPPSLRRTQPPGDALRDALVALGWTPPLDVMRPERAS